MIDFPHATGVVDLLDEWNGYKAGESLSVHGVLYEIVRIEKHDESSWAGAVLHKGYDKHMYVIDIPYGRETLEP